MIQIQRVLYVIFASSCFAIQFIPNRIIGLFFIHLQHDLKTSATKVSLALGIVNAFTFICGPLAAFLYNRWGAKTTLLLGTTLSSSGYVIASFMPNIDGIIACFALAALGAGLTNLTIPTMSGKTFTKSLSFVISLSGVTQSILSFGATPILLTLINYYGWRGSLLLTGGFTAHSIPAGLMAVRYFIILLSNKTRLHETKSPAVAGLNKQTDSSLKNKSSNSKAALKLLRNPYFVTYIIGSTFATLARISLDLYTVRYAQSVGIEDVKVVWVLNTMVIAGIVSGPIAGYLTSNPSQQNMGSEIDQEKGITHCLWSTIRLCKSVPRPKVFSIFSALYSISIMIPILWETYSGFLLCGLLTGIIYGVISPLPVTVVSDLFPLEDLATAHGLRCFLAGVGLIVYPLFVGHTIDVLDNYRPAQYMAAICSLICAILTTITQVGLKRRDRKQMINRCKNSEISTSRTSIENIHNIELDYIS